MVLAPSRVSKGASTQPLIYGGRKKATPFNTSSIRVVTLEGNPWFVAADVCRVLEIHIQPGGEPNASVAVRKLDPAEVTLYPIQGRTGQFKKTNCISESGLYKLIMRSDQPSAKTFQDWVTKEVLPSIRKTGSYVTGQPSLVENPQIPL